LQLVESLAAQIRNNMQSAESLVFLIGLGSKVRRDNLFQPVGEKVSKFLYVRADRSPARLVSELEPCLPGSVVGLGLDVLVVTRASRVDAPDVAPVAVLDRVDGSFAAVVASGHALVGDLVI
jgi:hypothetical protein